MSQIRIGNTTVFFEEKEAYSGVRKIADKVRKDIELVTGYKSVSWDESEIEKKGHDIQLVIYGTVDRSPVLDQLQQKGLIDLDGIRGKREVFKLQLVEAPFNGIASALVIAGSDKRGTVYGLFHLSELIGVSPLVNWSGVLPAKRREVVLDDRCQITSREPSVKYRGIFINDEWPAFGNWARKNFGDINAQCYEQVFELLLRHKANYLWPAMWGSSFNMDGPGLDSAELADELGIVMSTAST